MESLTNLLPNSEFNEMLSQYIGIVQEYLSEVQTSSYIPEILVFEHDRTVNIFRLVFDENKYEVVRQVGAACYQMGVKPIAIIMACEAWIREMPTDQPISSRPISSYADKKEVISITGMTFDGRCNGAMLWIDRDQDNNIALPDKSTVITCEENGDSVQSDLLSEFFYGYIGRLMAEEN